MKKLFSLAMILLLLAGCASTTTSSVSSTQSSAVQTSETPSVPSSSSAPVSSSSSSAPTSSVEADSPVADTALSDSLSKYMLDNFGGMGKAENAAAVASWYRHIKSFEVLHTGDEYYGVLTLNETVLDAPARTLLGSSLPQELVDIIVPPVADAAYALGLDALDVAVICDSLCKIFQSDTGKAIYLDSIAAYNIPVYQYLADEMKVTQQDILTNVNMICGAAPADMILAGITKSFPSTGELLDLKTAKTIALGALSGFKDVYLTKMVVIDTSESSKSVATFENPRSDSAK